MSNPVLEAVAHVLIYAAVLFGGLTVLPLICGG